MAAAPAVAAPGTPIRHVIVIMQENRSFDSYFGTFPGANGLPQAVCVPLNRKYLLNGCVAPFHDPHDANAGGPHNDFAAEDDLGDGITRTRMDGFVHEQTVGHGHGPAHAQLSPGVAIHDVMGYHTDAEIPNYWAYARNFVLQDHLFEGTRSWSLSAHLDLTSEWVATCADPADVATCVTGVTAAPPKQGVPYPWVNLPELFDLNGITWKYYLGQGPEPDCEEGEMDCVPNEQAGSVLSIWNPVPGFAWVAGQGRGYLAWHNPPLRQLMADIEGGTLPAVAWVVPARNFSEHPPASITAGMEYVTAIVNAVMQTPYWQNTAIFVTWDDYGGFYDHMAPPNVDRNAGPHPIQGFGLRVPGLMISAWARRGMIDHAVLSHDSYATFIEDVFLGGTRLNPAALGEPDARPTIRDALTMVTFTDGSTAPVGDLMNEFDFSQTPWPPLVLSTSIPVGLAVACGARAGQPAQNCTRDTVALSWAAVSPAGPPFAYSVSRDGRAVSGCTNVAATSCTDTAPSGAHLYRVWSTSTLGVVSPVSAAVEADTP